MPRRGGSIDFGNLRHQAGNLLNRVTGRTQAVQPVVSQGLNTLAPPAPPSTRATQANSREGGNPRTPENVTGVHRLASGALESGYAPAAYNTQGQPHFTYQVTRIAGEDNFGNFETRNGVQTFKTLEGERYARLPVTNVDGQGATETWVAYKDEATLNGQKGLVIEHNGVTYFRNSEGAIALMQDNGHYTPQGQLARLDGQPVVITEGIAHFADGTQRLRTPSGYTPAGVVKTDAEGVEYITEANLTNNKKEEIGEGIRYYADGTIQLPGSDNRFTGTITVYNHKPAVISADGTTLYTLSQGDNTPLKHQRPTTDTQWEEASVYPFLPQLITSQDTQFNDLLASTLDDYRNNYATAHLVDGKILITTDNSASDSSMYSGYISEIKLQDTNQDGEIDGLLLHDTLLFDLTSGALIELQQPTSQAEQATQANLQTSSTSDQTSNRDTEAYRQSIINHIVNLEGVNFDAEYLEEGSNQRIKIEVTSEDNNREIFEVPASEISPLDINADGYDDFVTIGDVGYFIPATRTITKDIPIP